MTKIDKLTEFWDRSREGEEKAFALLHESLYPGLFSYTMKMVRDQDVANDLLQDMFIKFWQNRLRIGNLLNVKAYFYRSARSMVLNYIRSSKLVEVKLEAMPAPDLEFSKEEMIVSAEMDSAIKLHLQWAMNKLPAKQREVIYMRFYEDLEYTQIAQITGIRYQSVINHVYRAIRLLRAICVETAVHAA